MHRQQRFFQVFFLSPPSFCTHARKLSLSNSFLNKKKKTFPWSRACQGTQKIPTNILNLIKQWTENNLFKTINPKLFYYGPDLSLQSKLNLTTSLQNWIGPVSLKSADIISLEWVNCESIRTPCCLIEWPFDWIDLKCIVFL